jgi:hypothetical protein
MSSNEIKVIDTWTQKGHSVYCKDFGPFLSLQQHSYNMNRFLVSHNQYNDNQIANWFHLASGINKVDYSSDLFDSTSMWCRPAYEYEEEKSKFHSRLITELTRFTFIWGGFEAFIDSLNIEPCPFKQGKINSINHFLSTHFLNLDNSILFYNELIQFFKKIVSKNPWYGNVNELFASEKCVSEDYIALKVVYKIRNSFAHGAFQFSEPAEWNRIKPLDVLIISISSRFVLLTMQLLIIAKYEKLKFIVTQPEESYEDGLIASKYIRLMHLKIIEGKKV